MRWLLTTIALCMLAAPLAAEETLTRKQLGLIERIFQKKIKTPKSTKPIPFAKILAHLRKQLPKKEKFEIRVDAKAFGKHLGETLSCPIDLSDFPDEAEFGTLLRVAVGKTPLLPVVVVEADHVLITTGEQSEKAKHYEMVHDVGDLVKHSERLRNLRKVNYDFGPAIANDDKSTRGAAFIAHTIFSAVDPSHWDLRTPNHGTLRIDNGKQLVVRTIVARHREIIDLLESLRSSINLKVVMETRFYEVDRAFYDKNVRPVLVKKNNTFAAVAVAKNDLLKQLQKRKPFHTSKSVSIIPGKATLFASLEHFFPYYACDEFGKPVMRNGTTGVSFQVKAKVSKDRRFLQLNVLEVSNNVMAVHKRKFSGAEFPDLEIPELRKTTTKGQIIVADGVPIVLRVDWQPKDHKKRYVALACPIVWVQEHVDILRQQGKPAPRPDFSPKLKEARQKKHKRPKSPLRKNDTNRQILQAIVKDIVTNPRWEGSCNFYGTPGAKRAVLTSYSDLGIPWPKWFRAKVPSWRIQHLFNDNNERAPFSNRLLGIRIDRFDRKKDTFSIEIVLSNVGGFENGAVIGGEFISYEAVQEKGRWGVRCTGAFDP